jgi:predicted permease
MARHASRQREIGTKLALGASRWKLVRESAIESLALSAGAAVLGLFFAYGASGLLANAVWTGNLPLALDLRPDLPVLVFTAMIAMAASFVFGVVPTAAIIRHDLSGFLHRGVLSLRSAKTMGRLAVALQVGLSTVLVLASLLFARSLARLSSEPAGYDSGGVLDVQLMWQPGRDKTVDRSRYYRSLLATLEELPDVKEVSLSVPGPVFPYDFRQAVICGENPSDATIVNANPYMIGPHFFSVLGIPILQGRDFLSADDDHSTRVALLSKNLAHRCFPSSNAIGRSIRIGDDAKRRAIQVIGIVADANLGNMRQKAVPTVYVPFLQEAPWLNINPEVELRTYHDPQSLRRPASDRIQALGQEYLYRDEVLTMQLMRSLAQERVMAVLAAFFGASSLMLVCIGLYGLMSYSVRQRSTELGVRMAIGASRSHVIAIVIREALLLTCLGLLVAAPAVLLMARVIAALLFDLAALDPLSLSLAGAMMLAAAAAASFLPARRASQIEPIQALRHE